MCQSVFHISLLYEISSFKTNSLLTILSRHFEQCKDTAIKLTKRKRKVLHRAGLFSKEKINKGVDKKKVKKTGGYATMVHGRGCNPHRCTTTFANVEITSLMTS